MVNLEWYHSFVAIYRAGTVSGAAQKCSLTQPAVSQHLAALEKVVGATLFLRAHRRMVPTELGKELYSRIADSLDRLDRTTQQLCGSTALEKTLIRVGTPLEYFHEVILKKLREAPFQFRFQFDLAPNLAHRLASSELDLIITSQRTPLSGIEYWPFTDERFCLVGSGKMEIIPKRFREENLAELEDWLAAKKWISYSVELPIIRRFWHTIFHHRPNFQPHLVIPNLHAIAKAVELDYGISILPEYLCDQRFKEKRLKLLWRPQHPISNEICMGIKTIDRNNIAIQKFRNIITNQNEMI